MYLRRTQIPRSSFFFFFVFFFFFFFFFLLLFFLFCFFLCVCVFFFVFFSSENHSFYKAIRHNIDHAKKSTPPFTQKDKKLKSPARHIQLRSYYRSNFIMWVRVLGFQNTQLIENIHNQFLRTITGLRKSTPIYMLQAELGRYPTDICIKSRMIGFWVSIINSPGNKISKIL